ncbi:hypothetical protein AGOR_G00045490 [Albula goreensis]|uniref:PH domain-containing protein n=1 Tax=Albula goreensis TaxID=1534307 RepID=A0A8T3DYW7_9TELE|nr:hypothetical protein AGOR_G00045490 [Albula goreensis]
MEGTLYKWTNYLSGWQPRWFVLDGGTLSYYDSQEDASKGCKGSIKISVCEIQVHPSDVKRMDLTIPGQQYFYLRAINTAERQKWLVAMGTAKACLTDNRTKIEKELQQNAEALRSKMSELQLYCDLLCQQVGQIRDEPAIAMEDGADTLSSTCSTFLQTLEECLLLASRTFNSDLQLRTPPTTPPTADITIPRAPPTTTPTADITIHQAPPTTPPTTDITTPQTPTLLHQVNDPNSPAWDEESSAAHLSGKGVGLENRGAGLEEGAAGDGDYTASSTEQGANIIQTERKQEAGTEQREEQEAGTEQKEEQEAGTEQREEQEAGTEQREEQEAGTEQREDEKVSQVLREERKVNLAEREEQVNLAEREEQEAITDQSELLEISLPHTEKQEVTCTQAEEKQEINLVQGEEQEGSLAQGIEQSQTLGTLTVCTSQPDTAPPTLSVSDCFVEHQDTPGVSATPSVHAHTSNPDRQELLQARQEVQ